MNFHTSNQSEDPNVSVFNGKMSININTGERDSVEDLEEERKQQEEVSEVMYLSIGIIFSFKITNNLMNFP